MCSVKALDRDHPPVNYYTSSGGGISLPYNSTKSALVFLGLTLNFI